MLKFKYKIEAHNFSCMSAFETYINGMGEQGYELVQWQIVDTSFMLFHSRIQPVHNAIPILITWKIESSK